MLSKTTEPIGTAGEYGTITTQKAAAAPLVASLAAGLVVSVSACGSLDPYGCLCRAVRYAVCSMLANT